MSQAEIKNTSKWGMSMLDFIGSTFTTATLAWAVAFAFQAIGFESVGVSIGVMALLLSGLAFGSLIVGGIVWAARHVRVTII